MQRGSLEKAQADGLAQGLEQGRKAERNAVLLSAHQSGLPPALIANLLGLDEAQVIEQLRILLH